MEKTNPHYKTVHSQVTQDCVKRLHNTWERFKAKKFGFPRFKKFGKYQSFLFPQFKENPIFNGAIKLPKIGEVEINQHRPIPDGFNISLNETRSVAFLSSPKPSQSLLE